MAISLNNKLIKLDTNKQNADDNIHIMQGTEIFNLNILLSADGIEQKLDGTEKITAIAIYNIHRDKNGNEVVDGTHTLAPTDAGYNITIVDGRVVLPFSELFTRAYGKCQLILKVQTTVSIYPYSYIYYVDENKAFAPQSTPNNLPTYQQIRDELTALTTQVNTQSATVTQLQTSVASKANNDLSNVGDFASLADGDLFYKKDGTIKKSPLNVNDATKTITSKYTLVIPPNSLSFSDAATMHTNGGYLEYTSTASGKNYLILDYENDPVNGSLRPEVKPRAAKEIKSILNSDMSVVMNDVRVINFGKPTFEKQVQRIYFKLVNAVTNLKLKLNVNGVDTAYYPTKEAWNDNSLAGYNISANEQYVDLEPFWSNSTSYNVVVYIKSDTPVNLFGSGTKPWIAEDLNRITTQQVAYLSDITGGGGSSDTGEQIVQKINTYGIDLTKTGDGNSILANDGHYKPMPTLTGDYVKTDGTNVTTAVADNLFNVLGANTFNQKLLNASALRNLSQKLDKNVTEVESIFTTNYHELSDTTNISNYAEENITLFYQFSAPNQTINQPLPPKSQGKLIMVGLATNADFSGDKVIVTAANGESINGSQNPIVLSENGLNGVFVPYANLDGYEYISLSEIANDDIVFYDSQNIKHKADAVVAGTGVHLNPLNGNMEISTTTLTLDDGYLASTKTSTSLSSGDALSFGNVYFGANKIKTNSIIGFNVDFIGTSMGTGYVEVSVYNGDTILNDNNGQPMTAKKSLNQLQELGTISKLFYYETSIEVVPTVKVNFSINGQNKVSVFDNSVFVIQNVKNESKEGIALLGYSQLTGYDLKYSVEQINELYNLNHLKGTATANPVDVSQDAVKVFDDGSIGNFITSGRYAITNNEVTFFTDSSGFKWSFNKILDEYESNVIVGKTLTATLEYLTAITQDDLKMLVMKWTASSEPTKKIVSAIENGTATFEPNWEEIASIDLPQSVSMVPVSLNALIPADAKRVALVIYNKNSIIANNINLRDLKLTIPEITLFKYDYITPNIPVGITIKKGASAQTGTTEIDFGNNEIIFDALKSKVSVGEDPSKLNVDMSNTNSDKFNEKVDGTASVQGKANVDLISNVWVSNFDTMVKKTEAYKEIANRKNLSIDDVRNEFEGHPYNYDSATDLSALDGSYVILTYIGKGTTKISQPLPETTADKTFLVYFDKEDPANTSSLEITAPNAKKINGSFDPIIIDETNFVGVFIPLVDGNYEYIHETQTQRASITAVSTDGSTFPMNQLSTDGSIILKRTNGNNAILQGLQFSPSYYAKYTAPKLLNDGFYKSDTVEYYSATLKPNKVLQDRLDTLVKANIPYLVCGRFAPLGRAKINGYISIAVVDLATGNILNDKNGAPCMFRKPYSVGDKFDFVEVAVIIQQSNNTNIGCKVEYSFGTELLSTGTVTEGVTGLLIHDLSQEKSLGLMEYELDTRQNILWSTHDFTGTVVDFTEHTKNNVPLTVIPLLGGNRDGDGWGIEAVNSCNYSVSDGVLTLSNIGSEALFGVSYVFTAEDTRILKNKDVFAKIVLSTNSNEWVTEWLSWNGEPDKYTRQLMVGMTGETVQYLNGWTLIDNSTIPINSNETETTAQMQGIPSEVVNLALLIRPKNKTSPQFLNIKSIDITVDPAGTYYSLYTPELQDELHFYQDDKFVRSRVYTDYSFYAGTSYNFLPFGAYINGDANVKFVKAPWNALYKGYDFNTNLVFENAGNVEIMTNIMYKTKSTVNEDITTAYAKLTSGTGENVSDYTIIAGTEFTFTLSPGNKLSWQTIPKLKTQVNAGDQLCIIFKATHADVIYVNAVSDGNYAVYSRTDFYEFTPSTPDLAKFGDDIETLKTKVQTLESNMTSVLEKLASFVITANAAATNTKLKLDNKADGTDPSVTAYKEV